jgi:hypothetical protein
VDDPQCAGAVVRAQDDVGVEELEQRGEVAVAAGGDERVDDLAVGGRGVAVGSLDASPAISRASTGSRARPDKIASISAAALAVTRRTCSPSTCTASCDIRIIRARLSPGSWPAHVGNCSVSAQTGAAPRSVEAGQSRPFHHAA